MPRSLALAALLAAPLAGCGASAPVVPVVEIAAAAPAAPEPAEDTAGAPLQGTYPRYATVSLRNGESIKTNNAAGTATLTIERRQVIYAQQYRKSGRARHVTQIYSFDPSALRSARDAYDFPLVHREIRGDVAEYSPDSGSPRLVAHKRPWGWEVLLFSVDTSDVVGGHAFGAAPPGTPPPDVGAYARRLGQY